MCACLALVCHGLVISQSLWFPILAIWKPTGKCKLFRQKIINEIKKSRGKKQGKKYLVQSCVIGHPGKLCVEKKRKVRDSKRNQASFLRPLKLRRSHMEKEVERFWEMECERQRETKRNRKEKVLLSCLVVSPHHLRSGVLPVPSCLPPGGGWNWCATAN